MSLYNKCRPDSFDQVRGNAETIATLKGFVADPDRPQVYLFCGGSGMGKTTLGRILAKEVGCVGSDFREMDSAIFRGIDTVREIRQQIDYGPMEGACRGWLFDEVHMWTKDAQNAALKMFEDTPKHVIFILCTTNPKKLEDALYKRCQVFQVKPLSDTEIIGLLRSIVRKEKKAMPADEVLQQITADAMGGAREAINILEKILVVSPEMQLAVAKKTAEEQSQVVELCRALVNRSSWKVVSGILKGLNDQEPEAIRRMILGYMQSTLLSKPDDHVAGIIESFWEPLYDIGRPGLVYCCYSSLK